MHQSSVAWRSNCDFPTIFFCVPRGRSRPAQAWRIPADLRIVFFVSFPTHWYVARPPEVPGSGCMKGLVIYYSEAHKCIGASMAQPNRPVCRLPRVVGYRLVCRTFLRDTSARFYQGISVLIARSIENITKGDVDCAIRPKTLNLILLLITHVYLEAGMLHNGLAGATAGGAFCFRLRDDPATPPPHHITPHHTGLAAPPSPLRPAHSFGSGVPRCVGGTATDAATAAQP